MFRDSKMYVELGHRVTIVMIGSLKLTKRKIRFNSVTVSINIVVDVFDGVFDRLMIQYSSGYEKAR